MDSSSRSSSTDNNNCIANRTLFDQAPILKRLTIAWLRRQESDLAFCSKTTAISLGSLMSLKTNEKRCARDCKPLYSY